jgi:outer membrane protein assembly factor BamB
MKKPVKIALLSGLALALCVTSIFVLERHAKPASTEDASGPHVLWSYSAGSTALSGIALAPNGTIHFAAADGVYALSPDAKLLWKAPLPSGPVVAAPALSSGGTLYAASQSGKLFALDASGKMIWESAATQHKFLTPPSIGEGEALYVTDDYSDIFAFAPTLDSNVHWKLITFSNVPEKDGVLLGYNPGGDGWWFTSPVIGADGAIYLAHQSWLYQISAGGEVSHFTQFYGGMPGFPAISADGTIYIAGHNWAAIAAVDRQGNALWGTRTSGHVAGSPVIDNSGAIYLCDSDFVKALTADGKQHWYLQIPCNSGPALAADGTLYLGTSGPPVKNGLRKTFLAAVTSIGQLKWKIEIHGMVRDAPAIGPDGTIFFTTDQGYAYAVSDAGSPPMDSPWPRFQHDAQNSGHILFYR